MTQGAEKLKAWRKSLGLSQTAAATRANVSQGTWGAWETGTKRPSIEQLVALARITSASEHAVTVHDFVETKSEADERRARRRGELKTA